MTARDRTVVIAIAGLLLVVAAWFLLVSPVRKDAQDLDAQVGAAQQRLTAAQTQVSTGEAAKAGYRNDYAAVSRLGKAVPADDDVPSLLVLLQGAAHQSKVDFRSIELSTDATSAAGAPTQSTAVAAASSGTTGTTGAGSDSSAGSASGDAATAGSAGVPATQAAASTLPPGASVGAAGFPTMPFDFAFTGSFFKLDDFLARVDRFTEIRGKAIRVRGRLLTVDGFALSPGPKGFPNMLASLHATAYLLPPDAASVAATATAGAPVAGLPGGAPDTSATSTETGGSTR